jgi:UDP-glucose 4-epimerase
MKVLITGGAGYIGSNLADRLVQEGHEVHVVDNLSVGKIENIQHLLNGERFDFVNGSILNEALMRQVVQRVDLIYHLAAVVGVKYVLESPLSSIQANVRGTETVLRLAYQYGKRTLLASSSEIYGKSTAIPLSEDSDRVLGSTRVERWSYSDSKALDEYLAFAYAKEGLAVSVVRYFNSYGPRLDPQGYGSVIARFITQALSGKPLSVYHDGRQTRCFTYIDDTLWGTILAATKEEAQGQVFNIGTDQEISILALAEKIKELAASPSEIVAVPYEEAFGQGYNFEETRRRVPDVSKAARILSFKAQIDLEDGLKRTIAWFKETGYAN